jgi:CRISPR-associated protein Cst2
MNLFATILTYPAPSANYRGESELNRSVIQKVTDGRFDYPIISPEAMRNALRESLAKYGLSCNRRRLPDEDQLAVTFRDYPDPDEYVDDFFFGYLVAAGKTERNEIRQSLNGKRGKAKADSFSFKRDSVLRMNLAKALDPYRYNAIFTQSPQDLTPKEVKKYSNDTKSNLLHRETVVSAFQYPFALNLEDCRSKPDWTRKLLKAIGELNGVAGNHARSYFEMAPASIVVRLTKQLVAGYETYGFKTDGTFPEVVDGILHQPIADYPGNEFYLGGKIVKEMEADATKRLDTKRLEEIGVKLDRDPRRLLEAVADKFLGG